MIEDPETIAALAVYPEGGAARALSALRCASVSWLSTRRRAGSTPSRCATRATAWCAKSKPGWRITAARPKASSPTRSRSISIPRTHFNERVERLVRQDGELEKLMRARMEEAERTLADTLTRHVGADSMLMQHLAPGESNQFLVALR